MCSSLTLPTGGPFISHNFWHWTSGGQRHCFSLKVRNTCSWHFVFSHLLNSRDRPSSEATAEQEWPALSPLFVWQGRRQCSGQPGAPAVWRSATPAVSLGEVRQRPLWSQVGRGHPGDQTAPEVQRVCRSMNCWPPAGEELQALMGMNRRLWPGGGCSRCSRHPFRKFGPSIEFLRLQPEHRGYTGYTGGAACFC